MMGLDELCLLATGLVKLRSLYASGALQYPGVDRSFQPAIPNTDMTQGELFAVYAYAADAFRGGFVPPIATSQGD